MKRWIAFLLALMSAAAFAATTAPVSLLNPSGSTVGQAIISTGPSSAPAWGSVPLTGITGTLAVGNGGTGASTLTAHGVLIGEGTSAVTAIGPGANGQMLLGVTGSDPYWGSNPAISGATVDNSPIGNATASSGKFTTLSATGAATFSIRPTFNGATPWDSLNLATPQSSTGVTNASNAAAGQLGEYLTNSTTGTSLTTLTNANAVSVTLTAGDWDVTGVATFTPANTTQFNLLIAGISSTSATFGAANTGARSKVQYSTAITSPGSMTEEIQAPIVRLSVAATTTVYLVVNAGFNTSTMTVDGFIRARRVR